MIDAKQFEAWLRRNTTFSEAVVRDVASRMKRADKILEWNGEESYVFFLGKAPSFAGLSASVKSQLRRAARLYGEFAESRE